MGLRYVRLLVPLDGLRYVRFSVPLNETEV